MDKQVKESLEFSYEQHPFLMQEERQDTPRSRTDKKDIPMREQDNDQIISTEKVDRKVDRKIKQIITIAALLII